jgi:hypothetical protein
MAQFQFDTSTVEKRENSFELLPAGWYTAQVTQSDVVALKSGNGRAIKLTFEILSDGYRGRRVWSQLNTQHTNPKAEQIAQQQLRELCDSIGVVRFTDTTELHNKPVQIRVKVRTDESGQYEPQNEVAGFKAAPGGFTATIPMPGGTLPPTQRQAPAVAAPAGATPPWAKKGA